MEITILLNRKTFKHVVLESNIEQLEQVNTDNGRFYKSANGMLYPSVTTVTGLMNAKHIQEWRRRVGNEEANKISAQAARRGTKIHQLCEDYINGSDIDLSKYTIFDIDNFKRLQLVIDRYIDNIRLQEVRLYSDFLKMAGTVDCIAEFDGKLSVIDFKTARKLKEKEHILNYFCQATAYAIMYEERTGTPVSRIVILISVDDEEPQIFVDKRDRYVTDLIRVRNEYTAIHGV
jgi:genome maintenance exonuclease 1